MLYINPWDATSIKVCGHPDHANHLWRKLRLPPHTCPGDYASARLPCALSVEEDSGGGFIQTLRSPISRSDSLRTQRHLIE